MKILYEDNHLIVVVKPANILVQGDVTGDRTIADELKDYIKEKHKKPGNVYLGIVHRLDRTVGGVMVFARTSKAAARLSEQIRMHQMEKIYHIIVHGFLERKEGTLQDFLLKDEKTNTVSVHPKGKEAILTYQVVAYKDQLSFVKVQLKTGRSHQIRVQFASRRYPIYGDSKYGENEKVDICLFASSLTFYHPITKEKMTFTTSFPTYYPWTLFH